MELSKKFVIAVKMSKDPAYRIARKANVHPTVLSRLIHGADPVKENDNRILAIAQVLGLAPHECFERDAA